MTFGIDIGTTSVAGVAVDAAGSVVASATRAHDADLPGRPMGVDEQDPLKLQAAAEAVIADIEATAGKPDRIGWTGQMHGVVAVDEAFNPLTPFVTWRDSRRYGGKVMQEWHSRGLSPFKCLTAPGFVIARLFGKCVIDPTFLESWHVERGAVPTSWLPETEETSMLGDNQAGVFAAQCLLPGSAVVNIGTSGQLSVVVDGDSPQRVFNGDSPQGKSGKVEKRLFVDGKWLLCRASLVGGQSLAALRKELGITWEQVNERAGTDPKIRRCLRGIVDDLFGEMDLSGVTGLVGVGNALVRNPALRHAVEERAGMPCLIPDIAEMAAYGVAQLASRTTGHRGRGWFA